MNRVFASVCVIVGALACASLWAADAQTQSPIPTYFVAAPHVKIDAAHAGYERYGEAEFPQAPEGELIVKQGHHWNVGLKVEGLPDGTPPQAVWAAIKPTLVAHGWTVAFEAVSTGMVRYQKDGHDTWCVVGIFGPDDVRVDIVEVVPPPAGFAVALPAAVPEKVSATTGDFPFIQPLPGTHRAGSVHDDAPMLVSPPDAEQPEEVATGSITKNYEGPDSLSNLEIITTYNNALVAAGWGIVVKIQGPHSSDGVLIAHYAKNGRNIWMAMHSAGSSYAMQVGDEGADLAATLAKSCHVALTGVLFDFNKATLKPESEPVLQQVVALASKAPTQKLEVQGHTDNVGGDQYNMTLSLARANSVMAWLTSHGVDAARLSAHGYGKTMPVASNDDDIGRAKNRRVEIARPDCKK